MADITAPVTAATSLTVTGLSSLASNTYCVSNAVDLTTPDPLDVLIEIEVTPGTTSGNKTLILFLKVSLDGTNYTTGPESGTTTTDEPNLYVLGVLPLYTNSTQQRGVFSVSSVLGFIPPYFKLVVKNEAGSALTAGAVRYSTIKGVSA